MEIVPVVHVISDSLGDTAAAVAVAAASQFPAGSVSIERLPKASSIEQIRAFLDSHAEPSAITVFHTIADATLRKQLIGYAAERGFVAVDLLGPAIEAMEETTGLAPSGKSGGIRVTDAGYFRRIDAMEYSVNHDDGRNPEGLAEADIVLIGVSRTSKTPLSMYLASKGYKVANIPLVAGIDPPVELYNVDQRKLFGLMSNANLLSEIRFKRLGVATGVAGSYAQRENVQQDLDEARALMRKLGCIVIRTDNRAIEETAQEILRYYGAGGAPQKLP